MLWLFDTNIFLRLVEKTSPLRQVILQMILMLRSRNDVICYTPQILSEFWNVCTRPASARGGLGLSLAETDRKVSLIEKHFRLLPDNLATFQEWRKIVRDFGISGVQVYDAKLVASMTVYRVANLATLNTKDFKRFPQIKAIEPKDIT